MENKISVVISSYNRGAYLDLTLPTLFNQNIPKDKYEIIIVDDRSQDNTKEVYQKYKGECDLRLIQLEDYPPPKVDEELEQHLETKGEFGKTDSNYRNCSIPKNVGIRNAKYNIIMFTDPEIYHLTNTIMDHLIIQTEPLLLQADVKEQLFKFRASTLAGYCYGPSEPPGRPIEKEFFEEFLNLESKNESAIRCLAEKYALRIILVPYPFNVAFPKEVLSIIGGYKENFLRWGYEDNDLLMRLSFLSLGLVSFGSVKSVEQPLYPRWVHLWHPVSRINNSTYNRLLHEKFLQRFLDSKDLNLLKGDL
jgi:glycosyltransferase involved in cell wall biosynthesis